MKSANERRYWRIIILALIAVLTLACAVFFTACAPKEEPDDHTGGQTQTPGDDDPGGSENPGPDEPQDIAVTSISFNKTSLTLEIGESETLTVTILPSSATDKSVTWSSTNSSVAAVSGGKVTAKSEGATTITATAHNGKSAICTVIVNEPASEVIEVTSVSLNKTSLTLEIGESETLTATILPSNATDKSITWSSTNSSIAAVSGGNVTAKSEGATTITATAHNGKSVSCTIVVETKKPEIEYALTNDNSFYTVIKYNGTDAVVEIPRLMNGLRVIGIAENAFINSINLEKVILPNTIESIGTAAFFGCSSLKEINIPDSVKEIGEKAFYNCSLLNTINKMARVEEVGANAFSGCSSLTGISFGESLQNIGMGTFSNCYALKKVVFCEGVLVIGEAAFDSCLSLTDITLPATLQSLGTAAFRHAEALEGIVIPVSLDCIPNAAFQGCISLKEIQLHENVSQIGKSAFSNCVKLQKVEILGNLQTFGNSAFYNCRNLQSIYYASELYGTSENENYIFYDAGIDGQGITLKIGASAKIPEGLFEPLHKENVPKITRIEWEEGTVSIDYFEQNYYLPYLQSVYLPVSIRSISEGAMQAFQVTMEKEQGIAYLNKTVVSCDEDVQTANLRDDTKNILDNAFDECAALRELTIPYSVTYLAKGVFFDCSNLERITLPFVGASADGTGSTYFGYIFGASSYSYNNSYLPNTLKEVIITNSGSIATRAFSGCSRLTGITIPDSMTSIGSYAFYNCSGLREMTIPYSVIEIGSYAFSGCSRLTLYTVFEEKPSGWASNWNGSATVNWGQGSAVPVLYQFVTNGGDAIEDIISSGIINLPVPQKEGYIFIGWYDNLQLEGTGHNGSYYNPSGAILYAKWVKNVAPTFEQSVGLEIENGYIVGIGTCIDSVLYLNMPIAEGAFIGCDTITKVTFGLGVTSIGYQAFGNSGTGCDNLTEVVFLSAVPPEIGSDVFGSTWNSASFTVYVPQGSLEAYQSIEDTYWQQYLVDVEKIKEVGN